MVLSTDDLSRLLIRLEKSEILRTDFKQALHDLLKESSYTRWLDEEQFSGSRFRIPIDFKWHDLFDNLGLIDRDLLQIKIHQHRNKIFCTDGVWIPNDIRVFPFEDESECLLRYIDDNQLNKWADIVIDPATGCGHHVVSLGDSSPSIAFDINVRSVLYASLNKMVNEYSNILIGRNDITVGIPTVITTSRIGNELFLINMPFALSPLPEVLPLTSDGGITGADLTFASLNAIHKIANQNNKSNTMRALVLCYSVGNIEHDKWEVVDYAVDMFGANHVKWKILKDEKMWRINGRKEQPNPMNLKAGLPLKADCRFYVSNKDRNKIREGYENLATTLYQSDNKWDVLGYGILDISI